MARGVASAGKIVAIALILMAPLAIHAAIASAAWTPLIVVIPIVQLALVGGIIVMRDRTRLKWLGPLALLLAVVVIWAARAGISLTALPGIPHAIAYATLLCVFGYTLLPDHEAILTRVVNAVRGPLPPALIVHTRRVTFAWCGFFAAQLVASVALYLFAPLEVWSFFINVLNFPLVVLMFVVEGLYRFLRFRDFPMDRLSDITRVVAKTMERRPRQVDTV
ncbi:MAG TPA: hypothetical protein VGL83_21185 [Stellaceae bacterium]|jgi:uncharacterized membrane protein